MTRMMTHLMTRNLLVPLATVLVLFTSPVLAQEYWEYSPWESETEFHEPTRGLETEYEDDGDVNVEREQYEWEPGEGYHEQEWYDPSDWFEFGSDVDYEDDTYDYFDDDYYDAYGYDYGYDYDYDYGYDDDFYDDDYGYYDYYDYDYDYAYDDAIGEDIDYEFDQQLTGRVESLQQMRGSYGAPRSVRLKLKTEDGETRTLHLGDLTYVNRYLPTLRQGDEIVIGGQTVERDGKQVFKAKEIRSQDEQYLIPDYDYEQRIEGELQGLRKVRVQDGDVELVVARVRTEDGRTMDVRLGEAEEMDGISRSMRRGAKVRVDGYRREVNGESSFVVQDFKVLQEAKRRGQRQGEKSGSQSQRSQSNGSQSNGSRS